MKEQPAEYYFVEFEGEKVATLRDLTCRERDFLISKYIKTDSYHEYELARLCKMLGADLKVGEEGWIFPEKANVETLEKLALSHKELFFTLTIGAEQASENYQKNREAIVKNLKELSSST